MLYSMDKICLIYLEMSIKEVNPVYIFHLFIQIHFIEQHSYYAPRSMGFNLIIVLLLSATVFCSHGHWLSISAVT